MRILKPQFCLVKHILKWKDCQVDPLGHCFRSSLRGIKVFKISKRPIENADFETPILFVKHILKWKDCQVDPLGHCFRSSLRGIKLLRSTL